ncbi:MAG: protein kinase domain-containing protein [Planctomycetota bacterium]
MSLPDSSVTIGGQIGPYKILRFLGEGGFAYVYLAEQKRPIRRQVALKIIKPGMDSKQVIARFEAERQALALLEHPNIAHVFSAGSTETGRPYFAMEYINGMPITEYCDKEKISIEDRLKLFIQICEAVQYAHQRGIIHRDIKPSNIIVNVHQGKAIPKVIDFGIAKATSMVLTEKTIFTQQGQLIGTPEYMSPEQADLKIKDIDTRTDIYSLGVVLYELLAGTLPFDSQTLREGGFAEIQRIIREDEPPRPSTKLSSLGEHATNVAQTRQLELSTLVKSLHKELEWIPLMAIRKERDQRYKTASDIAEDVPNYLDGNPLVAGPESATYRMKKFIKKRKGLVVAVGSAATAIIIGLVVSSAMYFQAEEARDKEAVARSVAEQAQKDAIKQREIAEQEAKKAKELAEAQKKQLYFSRIEFAKSKYIEGNATRLREILKQCPGDFRNWEWNYLWHISDRSQMTLKGHSSEIARVSFGPNGKRILSGSYDGTVKIWDAVTGAELLSLPAAIAGNESVSLSPDGKRLISVSMDDYKTLKIWDSSTGEELMSMHGNESPVYSVNFSPDGKRIVSGDNKGMIKVWDAVTGEELMTLSGHADSPWGIKFGPGGKRIVSAASGDEGMIKVWDAETGEELMTLGEHKAWIFSLAFSPDGNKIASASGDKSVKIWNAETGAELKSIQEDDDAYSVAFSPDGEYIAIGSRDRKNWGKVLDAESGDVIMKLYGHDDLCESVAFSPDGRQIVSGSWDGTIKVWDILKSADTMTLGETGGLWSTAYSPDGKRIASGGADNTIKLWDAVSGAEMMTLIGHEWPIDFVIYSPDGKRIASGGRDNTIRLWDASTGDELFTLRGHGYRAPVTALAFSPDGKWIASGGADKMIRIRDVYTGSEVMTIHEDDYVSSAVFSPDGKFVFSGSSDKTIKMWQASTGTKIKTFNGHEGSVRTVALSPDGSKIISGSGDNTLRLWDIESGTELLTFQGHRNEILSATFSPDGNRIVSGSEDETVKVWDVETGVDIITMYTNDAVWSVSFSPDKKTIVAGGDGNIKLWETDMPVGEYEPRRNAIIARNIIDPLYNEHEFYYAVIDKLRSDETLDETVRDVAMQIASARFWIDLQELEKKISEAAVSSESYIEYAVKACELTGWKRDRQISTLAAAYSEEDDFDNAVKWQKKAIELLPEYRREKWLANYLPQLKLYEEGKPYHAGGRWSFSKGELAARWEFDDVKDGKVIDSSGNRLDGKLIGSAKIVADPQRGTVLSLDGNDSYVDCGIDPAFDITGALTISAWVKVNKFDSIYSTIIAKGDQAWRLQQYGNTNTMEFGCAGVSNNQWGYIPGNIEINNGKWHHIAGTYDGKRISLYIDGKLDSSEEAIGNILVDNNPVYIGAHPDYQFFYTENYPKRDWNGLIDDVRIYSYALSAEEISELYQSESVKTQN